MGRFLLFLLLLGSVIQGAAAQTTARGEVLSYNATNNAMVLSLTTSDLRYNQIPLSGGLLSITIDGTTREAYLLEAEKATDNLLNDIRLTGFNPDNDGNPLVLLVANGGSALRHLTDANNPMRTFNADVGDSVRVESIAPPPVPQPREQTITITTQQPEKDYLTSLSRIEAENLGLFPGISGIFAFNAVTRTFLMIDAADYFTAPYADYYFYARSTANEGDFIHLAPHPSTPDAPTQLGIVGGSSMALSFNGFAYEEVSAGGITAIEGQQIFTDIEAVYLEDIAVAPGAYVNIIINGVGRAALVMDAAMYEQAQTPVGLSSNYILLTDTGGLSLIYTMNDGRSIAEIFNAELGSRVWIRQAKAIETIVREEVVVKVVSEIDPTGFFYLDVSPYELSFLSVLVGEYVDVQINGIAYRAKVVDDATLNTAAPEDDILLFLRENFIIITHTVGNTVTAEARFQVSVGDPVVIQDAPN